MPVPHIPPGYSTATPYLIVAGAAKAIAFYQKAFGATEVMRFEHGGMIGHAEIQIGDSRIMLADEMPEMGYKGPKSLGGSPVGLMLYVPDADRVFAQAIAAGAKSVQPVQDQFYGDRSGNLQDPFGHQWTVATHTEDLSPEELERRFKSTMASPAST